jgi:ABC-type proline/glycine betaine transport system permease subunit
VKTRFPRKINTQFFESDEPLNPAAATKRQKREDVMNHSMYNADRGTHLKIVVIGLLCATVVAVVGIFANVSGNLDLGTAALVKAGQPTTMSGQVPTIR